MVDRAWGGWGMGDEDGERSGSTLGDLEHKYFFFGVKRLNRYEEFVGEDKMTHHRLGDISAIASTIPTALEYSVQS